MFPEPCVFQCDGWAKGAVVGAASGLRHGYSITSHTKRVSCGNWESSVQTWWLRPLLLSSVFSVFLMASHTNLCCSFLDRIEHEFISAISISCLFRISCFCFSQPCGVNLSYEIQMSSFCFLSCNASFSSSQLFVGFMGCAKLRGWKGLTALASPQANSDLFIWTMFWCIAQYSFEHKCDTTKHLLSWNLFSQFCSEK